MSAFPHLPSGLSTEQKIAAVLFLFLGLGGVILGFLSFGAMLRRPFELQMANAPKGFLLDSQKQSQEMEAMKTRDTDGDGLTDYDEVYVYHTSPYLKDTDGDGIDDKTEILAGTDPNCPTGKTCSGEATSPAAAPPSDQPPIAQPTPPSDAAGVLAGQSPGAAPTDAAAPSAGADALTQAASNGGFTSQADVVTSLKSLDPTQARQLLSQAGLTQDQLSKLSDAQVKDLLAQAVDAAAAKGQLDPASFPSSTSPTP